MGKYQIIYADPPWKYRNDKGMGVAENHYKTMTTEEICSLPVEQVIDKNTVLFLWVTFPQLEEAFKVIEAWGFQYKTAGFIWLKPRKAGDGFVLGMGYWTRSNAEICLIATRGKPKRQSKKVSQLIISPREQHSKKPDKTRDLIVELMGDVPRLELFAREKTPGWDVWGNEVSSTVDILNCKEGRG